MKSTKQIIQDLFIDFKSNLVGQITKVEANGPNYEVTVCELLHLKTGCEFTQDGNTLTIVSISGNVLTVTSQSGPFLGSFSYPDLFLFKGRPRPAAVEIAAEDWRDKFPFAYVFHPMSENIPNDPMNGIDREVRVKIHMLDQSNPDDWLIEDHYTEGVDPMYRLARKFIQYLTNHSDIGLLRDVDIKHWEEWSEEANTSLEATLFTDPMDGVEITMSLPIYKEIVCNDGCI